MTVQRMDNVGIVVEDLDAAIAFFAELGLTLDGRLRLADEEVVQCSHGEGSASPADAQVVRRLAASRLISVPPTVVYRAFADPRALERWIAPSNMIGELLHFDFREGGSYRMRLTYVDPKSARGKTSKDADEVEVRITKLDQGRLIEQEVTFESEDSAYSGIMRVIWTFESRGAATWVVVRAENVPPGIRAEDHEAGMNSSLEHLASFLQTNGE